MQKKPSEVRLKAESEKDLEVLSAMIQDAAIRVGDIAWLNSRRRFATVVNRYCWEDDASERGKKHQRVRAGLRFENVLAVSFRNVPTDDEEHILALLAVRATSGEDGSATLDLDFSGFAAIRLHVECIEAYLEDITMPWRAIARPDHEIAKGQDDGESAGSGAPLDSDEAFEEG